MPNARLRPTHPTREPLKAALAALLAASALATSSPVAAQGFQPGEPLELRSNTKVFGGFQFAESCSYDPVRDLIVAPNAAARGPEAGNDGYVALINPDGSVNDFRFIGTTRAGLELHDPLGSDVVNGRLYVVDGNVVRSFDMTTGAPVRSVEVPEGVRFNDIEVGENGIAYMSQTGAEDGSIPERIFRLMPDGTSSVFVDGAPLTRPNGVAFDPQGNIVVVNIGTNDVLTFSPTGALLATEHAVDPGNDGLVITSDGTKYVSSVRQGTVSRIRPGQPAEVIASGIPIAASMCYDSRRRQLVIPMNSWNALAFVRLD